jgi:putative tricarboxylic transport membrane protein
MSGAWGAVSCTVRWLSCALVIAAAGYGTAAGAATGWKPEKAVEFIIPGGAGGGQDRTARVIQKVLHDEGLVTTPINVVNKTGGGGNLAYTYLAQFPRDAHYLATATATLITNHILGISPISPAELTPVSVLYSEYIGFAVNASGPIKTGADLIERVKKDPESVAFAFGTSRGNANHIGLALAMKAAGVDVRRLKVVVYKASIDATTALMGGHVDAVVTPTSTYVPVLPTGKIRMVAVAAPQRQGGVFAQVPTWREQGINVVAPSFRMLVGPRDLSAAQLAFWDDAFGRLAQNAQWKKELDENDWDNSYLNSKASRAFVESQTQAYRAALVELGLVK